MCDVNKCCFCIPLNIGVYLSAAYTIFVSSLGLSGLIYLLVNNISLVPKDPNQMIMPWIDGQGHVEHIVYIVCACCYGAWLLFGIMLIIGTANRVRGLLMPWVILTSVFVAIDIVAVGLSVYYIIAQVSGGGHYHEMLYHLGALVVATFLNILALVGVTAHFRKLDPAAAAPLSIYGDSVPAPYGQYKYHIQHA